MKDQFFDPEWVSGAYDSEFKFAERFGKPMVGVDESDGQRTTVIGYYYYGRIYITHEDTVQLDGF